MYGLINIERRESILKMGKRRQQSFSIFPLRLCLEITNHSFQERARGGNNKFWLQKLFESTRGRRQLAAVASLN